MGRVAQSGSMRTHREKLQRRPITHLIFIEDVIAGVGRVRDRCIREQDQALLNHNLENARWSLAQRDACERIEREIRWLAERTAVEPPSADPETSGP